MASFPRNKIGSAGPDEVTHCFNGAGLQCQPRSSGNLSKKATAYLGNARKLLPKCEPLNAHT